MNNQKPNHNRKRRQHREERRQRKSTKQKKVSFSEIGAFIIDYYSSMINLQSFDRILEKKKSIEKPLIILKQKIQECLSTIEDQFEYWILGSLTPKQKFEKNIRQIDMKQGNLLTGLKKALSHSQLRLIKKKQSNQIGKYFQEIANSERLNVNSDISGLQINLLEEWYEDNSRKKNTKYKILLESENFVKTTQQNIEGSLSPVIKTVLQVSKDVSLNPETTQEKKQKIPENDRLLQNLETPNQKQQCKSEELDDNFIIPKKKEKVWNSLKTQLRDRKKIGELVNFPSQKSFNMEVMVMYIESRTQKYTKDKQPYQMIQFLAGDETGTVVCQMRHHEHIKEGNMIWMYDVVVQEIQGKRWIKTKFLRQKIKESAYSFDSYNFNFNFSNENLQKKYHKYVKIAELQQDPPYQDINIKAHVIQVYDCSEGMIHFKIADDTASIDGVFPDTYKNIQEERVLNFFNANVELISGKWKIVNTTKTQLDRSFIPFQIIRPIPNISDVEYEEQEQESGQGEEDKIEYNDIKSNKETQENPLEQNQQIIHNKTRTKNEKQ